MTGRADDESSARLTEPGPVAPRAAGVRIAALIAFAVYLALGVAICGDYGATWDEPLNRDLGQRSLTYVIARLSGEHPAWADVARGLVAEQGPFFETVLAALEATLDLSDSRDILLMRHLATFLLFWLGAIAFYLLLRDRFADGRIALAGVALLVLTPRLFAHSFYNSKDAALTALVMIAMFTMARFVKDRSLAWALPHALLCAAATGVRVVALILPAVTVVMLCLRVAGSGELRERRLRGLIGATGAYVIPFALFAILFNPALWENPARSLLEAVRGLASANQLANNVSLYMGQFVKVDQLPWHYLPVWMLITIPLAGTFLFIAGVGAVARRLLSSSPFGWENVQNVSFILLLFVPVLGVVAVRPVIYDDWRHMYFAYPAFVAIAVTGLAELCALHRARTWAIGVVSLAILYGLIVVVQYHPYQNVYFNLLAGRDVESRFELDYWGSSFREGLEYVLRSDEADRVRVCVSDYPGVVNAWMLPAELRGRLQFVPLSEATWFLSNHRQPPQFDCFRTRAYPCANERYAVRAGGATLLGVYRLR